MLFSIVVPIYKVEKYLNECIRSLQAQSFQDFEVILVDDGSPDSCPQICDEAAQADKRFTVLHKVNGGLVSARKAGAFAAKGDYIICVDGDDFVKEDLLEQINKIIVKYNPDLLCCGLLSYNGNGDDSKTVYPNYEQGLYCGAKKEIIYKSALFDLDNPKLNYGNLIYAVHEKVVKKDLYIRVINMVPDDIIVGEDTVFTMNALIHAKSIYILKYAGYFYRDNEQSIMHSLKDGQFRNLALVYSELQKSESTYGDQIKAYTLHRIWDISIQYITASYIFNDYRDIITAEEADSLVDTINCIDTHRMSMISKIKIYLLIHKSWKRIYFCAKLYNIVYAIKK